SNVAKRAQEASRQLAAAGGKMKNDWLRICSEQLLLRKEEILAANALDLKNAEENNLSAPMIDRLRITEKTLKEMGNALLEIAEFPDPIGRIIESSIRPDGFEVQKVRVPMGVIFFIYESRPNVTTDAAAICIKSGNAVILRGGKEAIHSNLFLGKVLADSAKMAGLPQDAVQLVDTTDRNAIDEFLHLPQYINIAIPRGGEALIRRVAAEAKMPVIKHFTGNCHVYIDRDADPDLAEKILINAKCQRLGTCNTAESLVVHSEVIPSVLPRLIKALEDNGVEIRGDERAKKLFPEIVPAAEEDFFKEFLAKIISLKIVDSLEEAIAFINEHSSAHTEAIVSKNVNAVRKFAAMIDSSAVMINASTRLNDGGLFGLGAEIGISTDKFHARGPCGINELTSYKYVVYGDGHIRS
ncbi:MAG: glutamate-5-semialdehyde dehydrogenase, partial [Planctomycetia bacterium]|nr:glutamate-5-semialdehyde dehydrogenase [Planctomycetia bacterium]